MNLEPQSVESLGQAIYTNISIESPKVSNWWGNISLIRIIVYSISFSSNAFYIQLTIIGFPYHPNKPLIIPTWTPF